MAGTLIDKPRYDTYEDYPIDDLLLYAGIDCIVTSGVASKIVPGMREPRPYVKYSGGKGVRTTEKPMMHAVSEVEQICHEYIVDMEINGIKYDVEENRRMSTRMMREVEELEALIQGPKGINRELIFKPAEVSKLIYRDLGYEAKSFTASGEPSVDGDALRAFHKETGNDWLEWLAKRNDINSAHNTFIKTYVEDFVKSDGRIHPSYNLHGTSSFRITGDSPNLTQLPRTRYGYNIRNCYTTQDGTVMMLFDFSSAEVKILGALSKDPKLLKAIEEGKDFHSLSASAMNGIDYDVFVGVLESTDHPLKKRYKDLRQNAKALSWRLQSETTVENCVN